MCYTKQVEGSIKSKRKKTKIMKLKSLLLSSAVLTLASICSFAQDYTLLHSFTVAPDGAYPRDGMIVDGNILYGTTMGSGPLEAGAVWKINKDGSGFAVLKHCVLAEGGYLYGGLLLDGTTLYGVGANGGSNNVGVIFKLNIDGTGFTILKNFNSGTEAYPHASLVTDGNALYGTTEDRSAIFKINKDGSGYTVLKLLDFSTEGADTETPLVLRGNILYGAASTGGSHGSGTIFQINTDGSGFAVLKHFSSSEGTMPYYLMLDKDTLYGTTIYGGTNGGFGVVYRINTNGTGFSVLKHFSGGDGSLPAGQLLIVGDMLIGTTQRGGANGHGTLFQLKTDGTAFNAFKEFSGYDVYAGPMGRLVIQGDVLYGTTYVLGDANYGSIYKITVPSLPPVIASSLTNLTVATGSSPVLSVALNGTPPFTWQWLFNGTNLDGATNATLTLADFSPANVGNYSVTVSNPFGVVTSPSVSVSSVDIHMFAGVVVNGLVGSNYLIQATTNLAGGWIALTNITVPTQPYVYIDYHSPTNRQQFYRAMPQ